MVVPTTTATQHEKRNRRIYRSVCFWRLIPRISILCSALLLAFSVLWPRPSVSVGTLSSAAVATTDVNFVQSAQQKIPSSSLPTLIIAGLIQNAEPHLSKLKQTIDRVSLGFHLMHLVLYENDSTDNTVDIVKQTWSTTLPLKLVSESNITSMFRQHRTERLAYARNRLMSAVLSLGEKLLSKVDYLLIMDFDEVNYHLSHVTECLNLPQPFGACCASQFTIFYDLWPLRTLDNWLTCDIWEGCGKLSAKGVSRFYRHIPASAEPIETKSCFGGAALYNFSVLRELPALDTFYNWTQSHQYIPGKVYPVCEHVPFHEEIRRHSPSFKMYIQPKFLNDGPSEYDVALTLAAKRLKPEWEKSLADPNLQQYYDSMSD